MSLSRHQFLFERWRALFLLPPPGLKSRDFTNNTNYLHISRGQVDQNTNVFTTFLVITKTNFEYALTEKQLSGRIMSKPETFWR